jgi:hypothetical protein
MSWRSRQLGNTRRRKTMLPKMEIFKVLTCLTVIAMASATAAYADSGSTGPYDSKGNPNCSPGQQGCSANYATKDLSKSDPTKNAPYNPNINPNCSAGQLGCSANYATTDHSDDNPGAAHHTQDTQN